MGTLLSIGLIVLLVVSTFGLPIPNTAYTGRRCGSVGGSGMIGSRGWEEVIRGYV